MRAFATMALALIAGSLTPAGAQQLPPIEAENQKRE